MQKLFKVIIKLSQGKLEDWWKPETSDNFNKKSQCFIWQYGNYTKLGLNLNGINTLGENLADNGGIKEAYMGYGKYVINKPKTLFRYGDHNQIL